MISDVPGDDPAFIASGPTVGDSSTPDDALAIIARYGIELPASAKAVLSGPTGVIPPGDERLSTTTNTIIAAPSQSLEAAKKLLPKPRASRSPFLAMRWKAKHATLPANMPTCRSRYKARSAHPICFSQVASAP
jgi:hypothetical protein